ncbi:carboxypeptidase-like regulatory domain-containing protein [Salinibacter altiplanensis]|uniref:carboxypeptidase-like regulatory domain-containing protein n=1 Tax=Salinibacter altiplanensis TaxID=1803181 RepID=UPI000C9F9F32|nr:carboxypeptidase-like regulatory domain-containing protein [Salinibacter altiplanensis]
MNRWIQGVVLSIALLSFPGLAWAQQGAITGTVTEAETGDVLPGATVQVVGSGSGAATDGQGQYQISGVPAGEQTIRVSFVGYQASERTVEVADGETVRADFRLQTAQAQLEEVVVTGFGREQTRGEANVSVSQIDASELTETTEYENVTDLLQGRTSGVTVTRSSGNVGAGLRFNVRGGVSLNSDGQPLIFVDGTRITQDPAPGFDVGGQPTGSPLADLDPSNIASINVLKGPAATSLYGTDGTDGVVLIETKSGERDQDLQVEYQGTLGVATKQSDYNDDIYPTAGRLNDIHRQGNIQGHRVSISGAGDITTYNLSYSHRDTESIFPTGEGQRNNVSANVEARPTESLTISSRSTLAFNYYDRPLADNNIFGVLGALALDAPFGGFTERDSAAAFAVEDRQRVRKFQQSVELSYRPEAIPGLRLRAQGGADISARRNDQTWPSQYEDIYTSSGGERNALDSDRRRFNADLTATYDYDLTSSLSATTTAGTQLFTESDRQVNATASQIGTDLITDISAGTQLDFIGENLSNERSAGIIGRQQLEFRGRYSLELSVRRDWSTRLVAGETDSFKEWYPAARASAQIGDFEVIPDAVSRLNVRASWGQSGSLPDLVDGEFLRLQGQASGFGSGATIGNIGDPDLGLERVNEVEGGFDLGINNRYSLSFTYYRQNTNNSIVNFDPALSTGFGNQSAPRNVGEIFAQGIETSLDVTALRTEQYTLSFNANYSYREREVRELGGQSIFGGFQRNVIREDLAPFSFFGRRVEGARFDDAGEYLGPAVSDERVELGNPVPDHFGGFGLSATLFENLRVNAQAEYQLGHQTYSNTARFLALRGGHAQRRELQAALDELETGTDRYRAVANDLARTNPGAGIGEIDNFLQDADFLKLRSVGVRYDASQLIGRFAGTDQLRSFTVGFSASNLFTITGYDQGPDPEVNSEGSRGLIRGQDFLTLQNPREYTFTLEVGI